MIHEVCVRPRLGGFFKLEALRLDGTKRPLTGWFPNLITDVGLNRIGTGSYMNSCHVGTNNTAPSVANTALAGYRAGTSSVVGGSESAQTVAPYYGWKRRTYRFDIGTASGNLSEVGIATAAANGGSTILFSRALILDEFGVPTTVTVLADEILDVTYELRLYPPLTDVTQTVSITGSASHNVITRAAAVTGGTWYYFIGNGMSFDPYGGSQMTARSGDIGTIGGWPSGTAGYSGSPWTNAYINNSLYRTGGANFGLTQANFGGIRSISWYSSLGSYQTQFDPVINKTATKTLNVTFRVDWARNV